MPFFINLCIYQNLGVISYHAFYNSGNFSFLFRKSVCSCVQCMLYVCIYVHVLCFMLMYLYAGSPGFGNVYV